MFDTSIERDRHFIGLYKTTAVGLAGRNYARIGSPTAAISGCKCCLRRGNRLYDQLLPCLENLFIAMLIISR
jgi:hypothetical protein